MAGFQSSRAHAYLQEINDNNLNALGKREHNDMAKEKEDPVRRRSFTGVDLISTRIKQVSIFREFKGQFFPVGGLSAN